MGPNLTDMNTQLGFAIDKSKKLTSLSTGPKYLILTRNATLDNKNSLNEVSPFLIKKVIDNVCGTEVELCKKLRNGSVLIKTKNLTQATKLIQLTSFSQNINIIATEHNTLNFTKGVFYSNDLRGIDEDVILDELKGQDAVKVEKIRKKVDDILTETGLIIITFAKLALPDNIAIGYEKVKIRPFIPRPMRCNNCWLYGHTNKYCKNAKRCANCSEDHHINLEAGEKCVKAKSCINCKQHNNTPQNHAAYDKVCPIFMKEKEVQAIKTLQKTSRYSAISIYNQNHPNNKLTYSQVTYSQTTPKDSSTHTVKQTSSTFIRNSSDSTNNPPDYSDLSNFIDDLQPTSSQPVANKEIQILPRTTSKRTLSQLKKKLAIDSKRKPNQDSAINEDSSS